VSYVNSPASIPLYWGPGATQFATLPGWDASWLCRSIRAFQSYVIALNVTKGAAQIPNMVKWSDITSIGVPPADWNADLPTSSSGENPLQDLDTPIVDGLPMRSLFVIYSENQIWGMTPSGDNFIFDFQRLFSEGGMISPNCAVEVEGRHYVFGPTDIYVHDGVSKQSIIDGRNRDYVFRNLDTGNVEACFVSYNPALNEITFAYPSGSGTEYFQDGSGSFANRAAVLHRSPERARYDAREHRHDPDLRHDPVHDDLRQRRRLLLRRPEQLHPDARLGVATPGRGPEPDHARPHLGL